MINSPSNYEIHIRGDDLNDDPAISTTGLRRQLHVSEDESRFALSNHDASDKTDEPQEGLDSVDMALYRNSCCDDTDVGLGRGHQRKKIPKRRKFESNVTFGWFDWFSCSFTICLFLADIVTDIRIAIIYFRVEMWAYAGITTALIAGPSLVTCFLGLHWHITDYRDELRTADVKRKQGQPAYITPEYVWFLRIFLTIFQFGPVVRTIDYLRYGHKSQKKHIASEERKRLCVLMLNADVDGGLLRLFESFLESAPQLTWQLYLAVVLKPEDDVIGTVVRTLTLLSSWGSLAISLVCYHRALRNTRGQKAKMAWRSVPLYLLWRICEIGARVLCIALFASVFNFWVFAILLFHWIFISVWLRTTFYDKEDGQTRKIYICMEYVLSVICGYAMIFCFLNLREGHTRFRVLLFYFIFYVENFFMLTFWFCFTRDLSAWFYLWGFIGVLVLFTLHIVFQLLYYAFFHPTEKIALCLPCNRYVICNSICDNVTSDTIDQTDTNER